MPVTIVMPRTTPTVKVMQTESVGGKVVLEGESFDEAYAFARSHGSCSSGLTFIHPFDELFVAAGQGTVALEMLEDVPAARHAGAADRAAAGCRRGWARRRARSSPISA